MLPSAWSAAFFTAYKSKCTHTLTQAHKHTAGLHQVANLVVKPTHIHNSHSFPRHTILPEFRSGHRWYTVIRRLATIGWGARGEELGKFHRNRLTGFLSWLFRGHLYGKEQYKRDVYAPEPDASATGRIGKTANYSDGCCQPICRLVWW